ncbi:hypothetical protein F4677DRAFT_443514 [Hypoxylon crocopeplum]|nr:hypothetical protein F4677DRAFT_443514 [Hypoxylon crocopeplum]
MVSLWLSVFSALALQTSAQRRVEDLFDVDFTTNNEGGCKYVGVENLNRVFADSLTLAESGLSAVFDFVADEPEAVRLVETYFKPAIPQDLWQIEERYTRVQDWITNGGPIINGLNIRPQLYCHHGFAEKKRMSDIAMDTNCQPVLDENGIGVEIGRMNQYIEAWYKKADELHLPLHKVFPYFQKKTCRYYFDMAYAGGVNTGFCSRQIKLGCLSHTVDGSWVTLCPSSFNTTNRRSSNWHYTTLDEAELRPIPIVQIPTVGTWPLVAQTIVDIQPTATTLFHELFHLVLALAYYYTMNIEPNPTGHRVEFFTGYTTQG